MDPHILEIGQICFTEESALIFAQNHGLITSNQVIQNSQNMPIKNCRLGRAGCDGEAERTGYFDGGRQKSYEIIRCKKNVKEKDRRKMQFKMAKLEEDNKKKDHSLLTLIHLEDHRRSCRSTYHF